MHIANFQKGQVIVRTQRSKPYFEGGPSDGSYIGEPLIYIGHANGQIYFKFQDPEHHFYESGKMHRLPLEQFDEGWEFYIDPESLSGGPDEFSSMNRAEIERRLNDALKEENYELADKLKKYL